MADAGEPHKLLDKHKAITTLLPYAVRQERDGRHEVLDVCLRAAGVADVPAFGWYRPSRFANIFPSKATPRAIILASPHFLWISLAGRGDLVQQWAAAVSVTPYTEGVAQSVVNVLLEVSSRPEFWPYITSDVWSWLKRRPSLPPVCAGRQFGTYSNNVNVVRGLKDPEVFKSYLVLVWSEWDPLLDSGFNEMCVSIPQDFGGTGMGHHRADLIQRLDYVLGQLDRGMDYLMQHTPGVDDYRFGRMKDQYGKLRGILLEVNIEAIARKSYPVTTILSYTNWGGLY